MTNYKVEFRSKEFSAKHIDVVIVAVAVIRDDGSQNGEYLQFVGALVSGFDLLRNPDVDDERFWPAVVFHLAAQVEDAMKRRRLKLGEADQARIQMEEVPIDLHTVGRLVRDKDQPLPEMQEWEIIREFTL